MDNHTGPLGSPDPIDDVLPDAELEELSDELRHMYHQETLAYQHQRSLDRVYARLQELERIDFSLPSRSPAEDEFLAETAPTSLSKGVFPMKTPKTLTQIGTRTQQPPQRPVTALEATWRALAAVLVVALLGAGFFALLHGIPRPGAHSTTTTATVPATQIAATATTPLRCAVPDKNGDLLLKNPPTAVVPMPPPIPSVPTAEILAFLAKAGGTPVFNTDAPADSTYRYEPPVLVLPATYGDTADFCALSLPHYVVLAPVSNGNLATYDVVYNPTTQQFRLLSIGSSKLSPSSIPRGDYFPFVGVSSSAAVANLRVAKGQELASGTRPELVYFAPRPGFLGDDPSVTPWSGGGDSAEDPMWRLQGTDGKLYFVGIDGKVYTPDQLPIMLGTTFITNE